MAIFLILMIPISFLLFFLFFVFKKQKSNWANFLKISGLCYAISFALGTFAIFSSRSSTAAIGFIFLPFLSLIPATLGGTITLHKNKMAQLITFILLLCCYIYPIKSAISEKVKNNESDQIQKQKTLSIQQNTKWLRDLESKDPQEALRWMQEYIKSSNDDTWLIPIASSPLATSELLLELGKKNEAPMITIIRNPNVPVEILEYAYRKTNYPDSYFADLAAQPKTPKEILIELYNLHRHKNSGIEKFLASNVNLPKPIMLELAKSNDPLVLGELARNSQVECPLVLETVQRLKTLDKDVLYLSTGIGWSQAGFERCTKSQ